MPINREKCKQYRDTWAAPGSELFKALEEKDATRAERIYRECEVVSAKLKDGKKCRS